MATNQEHMECIGLFGTCGESKWRDPFIARYKSLGIPYFNPQVEAGTWRPGMVAEENLHFTKDAIILFPVTAETTGQGSLAEVGFSVAGALRQSANRFFLFMVEDGCNDTQADDAARADSVRSRALVKSKLVDAASKQPNIIITESLSEMLELSTSVFQWLRDKEKLDGELEHILGSRASKSA